MAECYHAHVALRIYCLEHQLFYDKLVAATTSIMARILIKRGLTKQLADVERADLDDVLTSCKSLPQPSLATVSAHNPQLHNRRSKHQSALQEIGNTVVPVIIIIVILTVIIITAIITAIIIIVSIIIIFFTIITMVMMMQMAMIIIM